MRRLPSIRLRAKGFTELSSPELKQDTSLDRTSQVTAALLPITTGRWKGLSMTFCFSGQPTTVKRRDGPIPYSGGVGTRPSPKVDPTGNNRLASPAQRDRPRGR